MTNEEWADHVDRLRDAARNADAAERGMATEIGAAPAAALEDEFQKAEDLGQTARRCGNVALGLLAEMLDSSDAVEVWGAIEEAELGEWLRPLILERAIWTLPKPDDY
jgi:hypothetical protein